MNIRRKLVIPGMGAALLLAGMGVMSGMPHTPAHAASRPQTRITAPSTSHTAAARSSAEAADPPTGTEAADPQEVNDSSTSEPKDATDTDASAPCTGSGATQAGSCDTSQQADTERQD